MDIVDAVLGRLPKRELSEMSMYLNAQHPILMSSGARFAVIYQWGSRCNMHWQCESFKLKLWATPGAYTKHPIAEMDCGRVPTRLLVAIDISLQHISNTNRAA